MASKVFGEISKAYAVLSDSAKRADYDASLDAPGFQVGRPFITLEVSQFH